METAAQLARLAVGTLEPGGGYPDSQWDYAALSFRRAPDDADCPRIATVSLEPDHECATCRRLVGSASMH
jgi:hypothetical protein